MLLVELTRQTMKLSRRLSSPKWERNKQQRSSSKDLYIICEYNKHQCYYMETREIAVWKERYRLTNLMISIDNKVLLYPICIASRWETDQGSSSLRYELQLDERFQLVAIMEQVHEVLVAEVQTSILYDSVESISIPQYIGDDWKSMNFVLVKLFKRNNKTSPFHILSHQVKQLSHKRPFHNYFVFSYIYIYYTVHYINTNEWA